MSKVLLRTHTDRLFYSFGILKHNVIFPDKILNNKVPESVCDTFSLMLHSHNTRSNNQIIIPQINTNLFGTYSITYQTIIIVPFVWNVNVFYFLFMSLFHTSFAWLFKMVIFKQTVSAFYILQAAQMFAQGLGTKLPGSATFYCLKITFGYTGVIPINFLSKRTQDVWVFRK